MSFKQIYNGVPQQQQSQMSELIIQLRFYFKWLAKLRGNRYSQSAICYLEKRGDKIYNELEAFGFKMEWKANEVVISDRKEER